MNVDRYKRSLPSTGKVISKYFVNCKFNSVMDGSLSDFQEKKINCKGPKNFQKPGNKNKLKKPVKRIQGQKDIRTALHSKNELLAYTKDFNNVCVQSGLDIDSEHLQLAIALSNSLQETKIKEDNNGSQPSKTLSSQERIGKIRTTLQEYGFTVPEIKISSVNKKLKRRKKNYKLLLGSEAEKQQLISDRYSQILFQNFDLCGNNNIDLDISKLRLYHISTNIAYEFIKNNDIFYVDDLIEHNPSSVGCMLRNWSEIPGRSVSPVFKTETIKLNEIEYTQDELDIVLSGTVTSAKEINRTKRALTSLVQNIDIQRDIEGMCNTEKKSNKVTNIVETQVSDATIVDKSVNIQEVNMNSLGDKHINPQPILTILQPIRSESPDMFDDDTSAVTDNTFENFSATLKDKCYREITINNIASNKNNTSKLNSLSDSQSMNTQFTENVTKIYSNDFMEITKCISSSSQGETHKEFIDLTQNSRENSPKIYKKENKSYSQLSQEGNVTRRKSNDFMEITECVIYTETNIEHNIGLTQCSSDDGKQKVMTESTNIESVDLTQNSNSNDDTLPFIQISGTKANQNCLDNTIILDDEYDIRQSLKSTIFIKETGLSHELITSITDEDCKEETEDSKDNSTNGVNIQIASSNTFFENYNYQHSESSKENTVTPDNASKEVNSGKDIENENIDLTQSSDSSEDNPQIVSSNSSLGKNDISVDYDDIHEENLEKIINVTELTEKNLKALNDVNDLHSSQSSEVFEILDNELHYSIERSKCESDDNFALGGLSIIDNLSNIQSINNSNSENKAHDSFLPVVAIGANNSSKDKNNDTAEASCKSRAMTPANRDQNEVVTAKTPGNHTYIIKMNEVTPILDYASMSTPEVHEELDKYGLKPFKRKKAIQLLTHIYNQTHPIVEACSSRNLSTPSKKRKLNDNFKSPTISPTKLKSPKKSTLSHNAEVNKEKNLYEITKDLPDIRDIECKPEEWVFQRREKAKVHSCRVPLHIAFHNYVTCRRALHEAILRYEPVNIDVIHKELAASGHRYDPKDLLKFMDKKCITVKTAENNARNNKKHY